MFSGQCFAILAMFFLAILNIFNMVEDIIAFNILGAVGYRLYCCCLGIGAFCSGETYGPVLLWEKIFMAFPVTGSYHIQVKPGSG